jgi:hypothetical protein
MPDLEDNEADGQDLAEVFDEDNITEDGRDIATSDLQRDVYDVTSDDGDATEALEADDDFDPDQADEAELEEIVMAEEDLDEPRSFARDDTDLVSDDDVSTADMEAGSLTTDEDEDFGGGRSRNDVDRDLDRGLEETFPASDPVSISPARTKPSTAF